MFLYTFLSICSTKNYNVAKVGSKCRQANDNMKYKEGSAKNTSKLLNSSPKYLSLSDVKAPIVFSELDSVLFLDELKLPTDIQKQRLFNDTLQPLKFRRPLVLSLFWVLELLIIDSSD